MGVELLERVIGLGIGGARAQCCFKMVAGPRNIALGDGQRGEVDPWLGPVGVGPRRGFEQLAGFVAPTRLGQGLRLGEVPGQRVVATRRQVA